MTPTIDGFDPEVLRVAQAAADRNRECAELHTQVRELEVELAIMTTRLDERLAQITRLESQLLIASMRDGQQVSIIEQINRLTDSYHESVHAEAGQSLTRQ